MKFAIVICVVAVATLAYSQPLAISAKQVIRPSPPVISGIQRPQPPVKQPTQQQESIPTVTSTQESIAQPPKDVPAILPQRPNVEEIIIGIVRPSPVVVETELVIPQKEVEYFNGKVIHEPHYPTRY